MIEKSKEKDNVTLVELSKLSETSEKLALEIRMISRAIKKIANGSLKKETIVLLIHDFSGVGKPDIRAVMQALESLETIYLNPEKKP